MKILKKEWLIWKFWKKGGVVEKKGEEETKSMPHAPVLSINLTVTVARKIGVDESRQKL